MNNRIYLDNAATTRIAEPVWQAMEPWLKEQYGNPSSIHGTGREAQKAIHRARCRAAEAIGAEPREILFTSGGSESDNWALKGYAFAHRGEGNHIITSSVEHHAVLHTCRWLEKQGFRVTYLPVDGEGRVNPEDVEKATTDRTILISIMTANNEIGTIEPVSEIGEIARSRGIAFHTDAVQAAGALPLNVQELQADMMSLSAHKFHGPKGTGILYIRNGTVIQNLIHGGAQERGLRAGTENTAGIVGTGEAITRCAEGITERNRRIATNRDYLLNGILSTIPDTCLNGPWKNRLPGNCHISFRGIEGEALLLRLDMTGIAASGGSACTSGSPEPSHVMQAIGADKERIKGSIRFSLSDETKKEELDEVLRILPQLTGQLRSLRV